MLLWIDTETTGLDPNQCELLEVGMQVTDLTQQALNALADAGLGNDSPAEAYVIGYAQGHDDALALAIGIEQAISATPLTPDEIERLALVLWEHNGERPIVYESGKRIADRELEWWKQVAVSAWGFINGTEKEQ